MSKGFKRVLRTLQAKPWQTLSELTQVLGYHAGRTLERLRQKGLVRRRVGDRPYNKYEYAKVEEA